MSDDIKVRKPFGVEARAARDRRCRELAEQTLGDAAKIPLVAAILHWINKEDLWMALEQVGVVKASYGTLVSARQISEECLATLKSFLPVPGTPKSGELP